MTHSPTSPNTQEGCPMATLLTMACPPSLKYLHDPCFSLKTNAFYIRVRPEEETAVGAKTPPATPRTLSRELHDVLVLFGDGSAAWMASTDGQPVLRVGVFSMDALNVVHVTDTGVLQTSAATAASRRALQQRKFRVYTDGSLSLEDDDNNNNNDGESGEKEEITFQHVVGMSVPWGSASELLL
eukprot:PhM_4_TR15130/c0_g1_i1/m.29893